ncbi:MAG: hypothetical protein GY788_01575 [bacterium]|nr:hypothetical protein [bacterium]
MNHDRSMQERPLRSRRFAVNAEGTEWIAVGRDDWIMWSAADSHHVRCHITDVEGRLIVDKLVVEASAGRTSDPWIAPADLREIPIAKIEAWVNAPAVSLMLLKGRLDDRTPDLSPESSSINEAHKRSMRLRLEHLEVDLHLEIPPGKARPDEFYRQVAELFATARVQSKSPAEDIAAANGVQTSTVHRWMHEGRKRGVVAPSRASTRE